MNVMATGISACLLRVAGIGKKNLYMEYVVKKATLGGLMSKHKRIALLLGMATLISLVISACGGPAGSSGGGTPTASCPSVSGLVGAGSTFDNPLFSQMFAPNNYPKSKCGVNVNNNDRGR